MLDKLKTIAHKWTQSTMFFTKCGCGNKRPKPLLWPNGKGYDLW